MITMILGGGWFVHYRANKRKAAGEAVQSEADGWKAQQEVYQETIANQKKYYDCLKEDFNAIIEENTQLRKENNELRKKVYDLENVVLNLKKELSRLGRRVDALVERKERKANKNETMEKEL